MLNQFNVLDYAPKTPITLNGPDYVIIRWYALDLSKTGQADQQIAYKVLIKG